MQTFRSHLSRRTFLQLLGMSGSISAMKAFHAPLFIPVASLLPAFESASTQVDVGEWIFTKVSEAASSKFFGGITGPVVDGIMRAFGFRSKTVTLDDIKTIFDNAVEEFAEIVHQDIADQLDQQKLKDCKSSMWTIVIRLGEMKNSIENAGPKWWEGEARDIDRHRMYDLDTATLDLVSKLTDVDLGLAGWQVYMAAVSLRLVVLATLMQVPGQDAANKKNIRDQIPLFVSHHWEMCRSLRNQVSAYVTPVQQGGVPVIECGYGLLGFSYDCDQVDNIPCDYFFQVQQDLVAWPVAGTTKWWRPPELDMKTDELGLESEYNLQTPTIPSHYMKQHASLPAASEKEVIKLARDALLFWIWSYCYNEIVAPLEDMVVQWWQQSGIYTVRKVVLRDFVGEYVRVRLDSRGELVVVDELFLASDQTYSFSGFQFIELDGGNVALRACNGQYVAAELKRDLIGLPNEGELVANRNWIDIWETFKMVGLANNKVAFRAYNGKYVTQETGQLIANKDEIGPYEIFELVDLTHWKVAVIERLICHTTEDFLEDELVLAIYVDGTRHTVLSRDIDEGESWDLNTSFPYVNSVEVRLWDEDYPDADDFLGSVMIDNNPKNYASAFFRRDGANYELRYSVVSVS